MKLKILFLSFLIISSFGFTRTTTFPLISAAAKGNLGRVKYYIKKGEDINKKNRARWTALAYAIKFNHFDIVKYLIENGANINQQNISGQTPLDMCENYKIKKYLISQGAKLSEELL